MKKILLCMFVIAFSINLISKVNNKNSNNSQTPQVKKSLHYTGQKIQHILNPDKTDSEAKFIMDVTAKRVDSISTITDNGNLLYRFNYNQFGKVLTFNLYRKEGASQINMRQGKYTYNAEGKNTSETRETWSNDSWKMEYRYTYTYNAAGLMDTLTYEEVNGAALVYNGRLIYNYNSKGLVIIVLEQSWSNGQWVNVQRDRTDYYPDGKIYMYYHDKWENGAWRNQTIQTSLYNDWGAEVSYFEENTYSNGSKYFLRGTFSYNSEKKAVERYFEESSDSVWAARERMSFVYEKNPSKIISTDSLWTNSKLVYLNRVEQIYDLNDRLLNNINSEWNLGKWNYTSREFYSYNQLGNILTYSQDEYADSTWSLYRSETYGYDAAEELLTTFKGYWWDNGQQLSWDGYLSIKIDNDVFKYFSIYGKEISIWYKTVPVPVELTSFSGKDKEGSVELNWQTATETNNKGFDIERKADSGEWQKIGTVQGNGTTTKKSEYIFIDGNPALGKLFYRLRQIDFDGSEKYSPEVEISTVTVHSYSLSQNYPNPFNPLTVISYSIPTESKVNIKIYNLMGQLVNELVNGTKNEGAYEIRFDASAYSSGIYFYTINADALNGCDSYTSTRKMILIK